MNPAAASLQMVAGRWQVSGALSMDTVEAVLVASTPIALPQDGIIDLTAVDRVDSAGVALVLAWARRAASEGTKIAFAGIPESMRSLATLYGVEELLVA
jgi:phospholipid transport system transporter-binding protein